MDYNTKEYFNELSTASKRLNYVGNFLPSADLMHLWKFGAFRLLADRAEELNFIAFAAIIRDMCDREVCSKKRVRSAWYFNQYLIRPKTVKMWTDATGRKVPISELDDGHLVNIIRLIARDITLTGRRVPGWTLAKHVEAELPNGIGQEVKKRGIIIELMLPYENSPQTKGY